MKKIILASLFLMLLSYSRIDAQCPTCTPDYECISADGNPILCPFEAPVAFVGEYYEEVMTFYIPAEVEDPGSGILATLLAVTFTSASGVPYGLDFTINDADSTYYPVEGENHGCATICGVPLLPGNYTVNVTVSILAEAFGFEVTQIQNFPYNLVVEPGEGGTSSFTLDNPAACGGLDVNFEAIIVGPAPSITTYEWDFGNGETSTNAAENIFYDETGEYEVTLVTTVANYSLNSVSVSNLSDNGNGDVDEVFSPPADPYFLITDGSNNTVYTSTTVDNSTSTTWNNVNLSLLNPPYSIQFFDEDDISQDDDLGTTIVLINEGTNFFDIGNGTVGTFTLSLVPTTVVNDTSIVFVFPFPDPTFIVDGTTLYFDDPELVGFVWYINGIPTDNFTNTITLEEGGEYFCEVTNTFGCGATSSSYLYCPEITILFDELANEVYVDDIYESYQWFLNGVEISGADLSYVSNVEAGNYAVEVVTGYGCTTLSEVYTVGVTDEMSLNGLSVYPNPVSDILNLNCADCEGNSTLTIYDILGHIVMQTLATNRTVQLDLSHLQQGAYIIEMNHQRIRIIRQ